MNVLFLDDDPDRIRHFRNSQSQVRNCDIYTVTTVQDCIKRLNSGTYWDIVFLDHDLGGEVFVDSNRPDTGMAVVRWICKHRPAIGRIVVHSHNGRGAELMLQALKQNGYGLRSSYQPFYEMFPNYKGI